MHQLQELIRLHRLGRGSRAMARTLKMGRDTIRAYRGALLKAGLLEGRPEELPELEVLAAAVAAHLPSTPPPQQHSSVESWYERIGDLVERGAGPTAIFDRLRLEHADFPGSLSAVKRLVLRHKKERGIRPEDVTIPVETEPGEVAYVDFGYAGLRYDKERGVLRKSWVFVMVLGHSRHLVAYLVFDQKIETWLRLHVRAFQELGGVPRVIVPDNLKSAVVRAAFGIDGEPVLNRSYRELARHYGFRIEPTPPRSPHLKGKVESGVKYLRYNFLATWESVDLETDQAALKRWLKEVAGQRRHGTTGRRPAEVFAQEEQEKLLPLPRRPYELVIWRAVRVHRDCHVQVDRSFYSVPWRLVGETLWVRATPRHLSLYHQDARVADHSRVAPGRRATRAEHLPAYRGDLRHRSRSFWEERAARIGPKTLQLVQSVFDSDDVLSKLRVVQAIVTHLETFPRERAEAAAHRALFFGCTSYRPVRDLLRKGLDLVPLSEDAPRAWSREARFARKPSEIPLTLKGAVSWRSPTN